MKRDENIFSLIGILKAGGIGINLMPALSDQQRNVIICLCAGLQGKEIARELCISVKTYDIHRNNLKVKLGGRSNAEIVLIAVARGYVTVQIPDMMEEPLYDNPMTERFTIANPMTGCTSDTMLKTKSHGDTTLRTKSHRL